MKSFGGLFGTAVSTRNLWRAWREFRRGKRGRSSVRAFELEVERQLMALHRTSWTEDIAAVPTA